MSLGCKKNGKIDDGTCDFSWSASNFISIVGDGQISVTVCDILIVITVTWEEQIARGANYVLNPDPDSIITKPIFFNLC